MESPTLTDEQQSQVTIWYKCPVCFGFLYSIPELKKHLLNAHNVKDYKVPKDAPPDAENGKIYFMNEYFNTSPNSLPKSNQTDLPAQRNENNETLHDTSSSDSSLENHEFDIRLRKLEDLQETLSSSDEDESIIVLPSVPLTKKTPEEENRVNISSPKKVVSPPDSGISEINEDEVQPAPPNRPTVGSVPETLDKAAETAVSSETNKFQCDACEKSFPFLGPLNFHIKVKHKPLILTIRRTSEKDSYKVFESNQIIKPKEDLICAEKNSTRTNSNESKQSDQSPIKRASVLISTEASSGEREEAGMPTLTASSDKTNEEGESDNDNHDSSSDFIRPKRRRACVLESSSDVSNEVESQISYGLRRSLRSNTKILKNSTFLSPSSSASSTKGNETKRGKKNKPEIDDSDSDIPPPSLTNYGSCTDEADNSATFSCSDSDEDLFYTTPKKKRRRHSTQPVNDEKDASSKRGAVGITVCSNCGMECKNGPALHTHMVKFHDKRTKMICGYCKKIFKYRSHFNRHIATHHTK